MKERYEREIIAGFPYPIVAYFIKLGTVECLDPGPLRFQYILSTAEAISRFLGVVVLCECRELLEAGEAELPVALTADFSKRFTAPTWGNWIHFTMEGLKWLAAAGADLTMPELVSFFFKKIPAKSSAASAMDRLTTIRNGLSHHKISAMTAQEFTNLCEETYPLLEEILEGLDFLLDYTLAFISQIEVDHKRKNPPTFLHKLSKLIGDSIAFRGDRKELNVFMDSSAILLLNTENRRYLNLDPLLVREESAGKAPDIFFFNGMKKAGRCEYAACNQGGGFVSTDEKCARGQELDREIQNVMRLFTPKN
jgi:hypothetical protein